MALPLAALGFVGLVLYRALSKPAPKSKRRKGKKNKGPYTGAYDPNTGLGRGAPGFQTNIKKVSISPALAARIRAGENVSADEVTRDLEQQRQALSSSSSAVDSPPVPENVDPDWLPPQTNQGRKKRR